MKLLGGVTRYKHCSLPPLGKPNNFSTYSSLWWGAIHEQTGVVALVLLVVPASMQSMLSRERFLPDTFAGDVAVNRGRRQMKADRGVMKMTSNRWRLPWVLVCLLMLVGNVAQSDNGPYIDPDDAVQQASDDPFIHCFGRHPCPGDVSSSSGPSDSGFGVGEGAGTGGFGVGEGAGTGGGKSGGSGAAPPPNLAGANRSCVTCGGGIKPVAAKTEAILHHPASIHRHAMFAKTSSLPPVLTSMIPFTATFTGASMCRVLPLRHWN